MPGRLSYDEVIARFCSQHGDRYDYSRVQYSGSSVNVEVICKQHGLFSIQPPHHWNGVGCKQCASEGMRISKVEFEERARIHFGSRYDYGQFVELLPFGEKIPIICLQHQIVFHQEARNHMRGHLGCPKCKSLKLSGVHDTRGMHHAEESLTSVFVEKAKNVHGKRYDYSRFIYTTTAAKSTIICCKHGEFSQCASNHLRGSGCPVCARESFGEGSFKQKCKELGVDYWRALKRREAGFVEEKVFANTYIRADRETSPLTIYDIEYPNLRTAVRALKPHASAQTIARWLCKCMSPEAAFEKIPNPGFANGIIYLVTHVASGKQYVGLTVMFLKDRWSKHLDDARNKRIQSEVSLHEAIRQHGADTFSIEQVDSGECKLGLEKKEREWIRRLNTLSPNGFNISPGGTSGGSNGKPTQVDGKRFRTVNAAAIYISETRGISFEAAKGRLRHNKIDTYKPAAKGQSIVKTSAYKAWSQVIHGVLNPNSKSYNPDLTICDKWKKFSGFFEDVGQPRQVGMAFTRFDKSRGYFPENCAWMSKREASQINVEYMKKIGTLVGRKKRQ
jgi:hypothetical protein